MPPSKWRSANAQHFTLVHRSQQDPLVNDGEASSRVFKATPKRHEQAVEATSRLGQSRQELEKSLGSVAKDERENVGEAAAYGILFDDTEYDYMKHLRAIGGNDNSRRGGKDEEGDEEVIMLQAPKARRTGKEKAKGDVESMLKESNGGDGALQLPQEVLPSNEMMPRVFEEDKQYGIRPDMDPHLRQVLEALDDDAFLMRMANRREASGSQTMSKNELATEDDEVEEEGDIDDFFGEIVSGGAADGEDDEKVAEWRRLPPEGEESIWLDPSAKAARELIHLREQGKGVEDLSLEARVALFKQAAADQASKGRQGAGSNAPPSSVGSKSIFGEKGASRRSRHAGSKARLAASFYAPSIDGGATAFSMSSSAMERNQGLTHLDEQFARMERIYEQEDDDDDDAEDHATLEEDDDDDKEMPEDVNAIFDDFLSKNEIIGKRMHERLGVGLEQNPMDVTPLQKVDLIRQGMGEVRSIDKRTLEELQASGLDERESVEAMISRDLAQRRDARNAWDVETIQSTRTNVENHPRTIAASESVAPSRVSRVIPGSITAGSSIAAGSVAGMTDKMARIKIDPRTGRASVAGYINVGARQARRQQQQQQPLSASEGETASKDEDGEFSSPDEDEDDERSDAASDDTTTESTVRAQTIKRDRNESKEEKKARKQAAKEEKQNRKAEKASRKQQFKAALHAPTSNNIQGITLR
jgi:protein LTV1